MAQPQPCPTCGVLATDRERHRRDHLRTDALAQRVEELERVVERHHPTVEGRADVDLHTRDRDQSRS